MLHYRKKSFARAHTLLEGLRQDSSDTSKLREIQILLFREIRRGEQKIRHIKKEARSNHTTETEKSQKATLNLERRLERARQCVYIFRCFGDAVAFLYMDKYALKHVFYNTHNMNPKQSSGFIADKAGIAQEINILETLLQQGIPALLTDLTNTIRHGDICIMSGDDPQLVEVKSSKKLDVRGKRQKRDLHAIRSFFETDKTTELRGVSSLIRSNYDTPECSYAADMNPCISEAMRSGHATRRPELGVYYLAITGKSCNLKRILDEFELKSPWIFVLNEHKSTRTWTPYLPFTLSIKGWEELWAFITGRVSLFVFIEPEFLCKTATACGCTNAKFETEGTDIRLFIDPPGVESGAYISMFPLLRIGLEFLSPAWTIQSSIEAITRGYRNAQLGG